MPSLPPKKKIFVNTRKRLLEIRNWTFPVVRYIKWRLVFFSNILSVLVVYIILVYAPLTLSFPKTLFLNYLCKIMHTKVVSLLSFMKLSKLVSTPLILFFLKALIVGLSLCLQFATLRRKKKLYCQIFTVKVIFLCFLFI